MAITTSDKYVPEDTIMKQKVALSPGGEGFWDKLLGTVADIIKTREEAKVKAKYGEQPTEPTIIISESKTTKYLMMGVGVATALGLGYVLFFRR